MVFPGSNIKIVVVFAGQYELDVAAGPNQTLDQVDPARSRHAPQAARELGRTLGAVDDRCRARHCSRARRPPRARAFVSLDVVRGLAVAGMVLVENLPGPARVVPLVASRRVARPHDRGRGVPALPRARGCRHGAMASAARLGVDDAPLGAAFSRAHRDRPRGLRMVGRGWRPRLVADPWRAAAHRPRRAHRRRDRRRRAQVVGGCDRRRGAARGLRMDAHGADRSTGVEASTCRRARCRGNSTRRRSVLPTCIATAPRATTPRAFPRPRARWPRCSSDGWPVICCDAAGWASSSRSEAWCSCSGCCGSPRSR